MLQRIGLAQALIHDPELVILDEPMEGLDPIGRRMLKDIIADLGRRGKTVFFSSHILEDVEAICDRVAILVNGKIQESDVLDNLPGRHVTSIEVQVIFNDGNYSDDLMNRFQCTQKQGNKVSFAVEDDAVVFSLVDAVRQEGGRIISVIPHRATLEEIFLQSVAGGK
jgi:ABC-2 type transport system ATP-binding protein